MLPLSIYSAALACLAREPEERAASAGSHFIYFPVKWSNETSYNEKGNAFHWFQGQPRLILILSSKKPAASDQNV